MVLNRRNFLRLAAVAAGAAAGGAPPLARLAGAAPRVRGRNPDVVVIGAGAFGGWTALFLRERGADVLLLDAYGAGNSRATSGDETRGVRTSYSRPRWVSWATEAIARWREWDERWADPLRQHIYFTTGDLVMRSEWTEEFQEITEIWDGIGVTWERLPAEEIAYRYPHFGLRDVGVGLLEHQAGVARSRRACETVAETFRHMGGQLRLARVEPGRREGGRMLDVLLHTGESLSAGQFVFACGPWLPKTVPEMDGRLRISMGHVFYYGTPPGDDRFTYPNMPSFGFPGVTGWPALGPDNRGFRVRTGGRPPEDPDLSDRWIDASFHDLPREFLADRFPDLAGAPLLETRACHYESSSSRNFIIDRIPGLENAWVAGAGNAEGFKFGPVLGEFAAHRILGPDDDPELAAELAFPETTFDEPGSEEE